MIELQRECVKGSGADKTRKKREDAAASVPVPVPVNEHIISPHPLSGSAASCSTPELHHVPLKEERERDWKGMGMENAIKTTAAGVRAVMCWA